MAIEIVSTKGLSERPLVVKIVDNVQANPNLFIYIARVFSDYRTNTESLREEIFSYIHRIFNSPRLILSVDSETVEYIISLMKEIYLLESNQFNKIRAEILENTVYHFGPLTKDLVKVQVFIEPTIKEGHTIIGESEIKCDLVFYQSEAQPLEFVECKAEIANIVPRTLPFEKVKDSHKKKITYLNNVYRFFNEKYLKPKIYFACYNLDYSRELHNLQENWGFLNMDFVNAEEIIKGKIV